MNDEPKLETSQLSQEISSGGKTVSVQIYRLEGETTWALEIVDEYNNSTVWDDTFETESAALTEAKKTILAEGVTSLVGPNDGKSDGDWK
ncbi:MAG: hypothetical protein DRQ58_07465 [Gammaproteobacteria bacterium]|nr:MAG: hypothetical protein DRQ58_07465 [Gammaproteobacteria bacterium]